MLFIGGFMPHEYNVPVGYAEEEVKEVIDESIASRLEFAQRRLSAYQASCTVFEDRYGMSSQEFLEKFESGTRHSGSSRMTVRDYYRSVLQLLTTSAVVTGQRIEFDEQDVSIAY